MDEMIKAKRDELQAKIDELYRLRATENAEIELKITALYDELVVLNKQYAKEFIGKWIFANENNGSVMIFLESVSPPDDIYHDIIYKKWCFEKLENFNGRPYVELAFQRRGMSIDEIDEYLNPELGYYEEGRYVTEEEAKAILAEYSANLELPS